MTEQFVVGIVHGSHGITGEFKVESTSGEYEHFRSMEEVTLTDDNVSKLCKVESISIGHDTVYMKLAGINSPEEAAKYNRWKIVVPRKNAHQLQKDEWYFEDLKGCSIWYCENQCKKDAEITEDLVIGCVTNVMEGGSGYLVEIKLSESCKLLSDNVKLDKNGLGKIVYVPFNKQFIGEVDVENKKIQLMHLWILE